MSSSRYLEDRVCVGGNIVGGNLCVDKEELCCSFCLVFLLISIKVFGITLAQCSPQGLTPPSVSLPSP